MYVLLASVGTRKPDKPARKETGLGDRKVSHGSIHPSSPILVLN